MRRHIGSLAGVPLGPSAPVTCCLRDTQGARAGPRPLARHCVVQGGRAGGLGCGGKGTCVSSGALGWVLGGAERHRGVPRVGWSCPHPLLQGRGYCAPGLGTLHTVQIHAHPHTCTGVCTLTGPVSHSHTCAVTGGLLVGIPSLLPPLHTHTWSVLRTHAQAYTHSLRRQIGALGTPPDPASQRPPPVPFICGWPPDTLPSSSPGLGQRPGTLEWGAPAAGPWGTATEAGAAAEPGAGAGQGNQADGTA